MQSLPDSFMTWLDPNMRSYFRLQNVGAIPAPGKAYANLITQSIKNQIREIKSGEREDSKDADHRTIFYEIINSGLPEKEKSDARLAQDGQTVVIAGTITTAWALCVAFVHLLSQPETLKKLKTELQTVLKSPSSPISFATLEQLPYPDGLCSRMHSSELRNLQSPSTHCT